MAMDSVLLAALLGTLFLVGTEARPQIPAPSAPSAPGTAPGAPGAPAAVPSSYRFVPILQQHFEQAPDGQYRWSYAAADGTAQEAVGELTASRAIAVQGSYSYPSPEGQVQVKYVADEFGFQPTGEHIHPAILEAVRRQVEQARAEPPNFYNDAGFPVNAMIAGSSGPLPPPLPLPAPSAPQGGLGGLNLQNPALAGLVSGPSALL